MKRISYTLVSLLAVIALLSGVPAAAQETEPPPPILLEQQPFVEPQQAPNGAVLTPTGLWQMPAEVQAPADDAEPQTSGGPDSFGYTWNDNVPFNWVVFSGGTDTGINNTTYGAGPFDLGFNFKYYDNTFSRLYVSRNGFVSFNDDYLSRSQSEIPSPASPNDVIAPHWAPVYRVNGSVRYLRGGSAPNRWFLVGWNRVVSECCNDAAEEYTFEVILYENGNILFQYREMNVTGSYYCQASGIEDNLGLDGLSITDFCRTVAANHAVRITRPAPAARVKIFPQYQGKLTRAGETVRFEVPIQNSGDLGSDTYDLIPTSGWPLSLFAADGATPLTDTNGDGITDTGAVAQGATATIVAKVWTPANAAVAHNNQVSLLTISTRNASVTKTAILRTSVPTAFAQVYTDGADGAMSLYAVRPQGQIVKKATDNGYYGNYHAVVETPNGNLVYSWVKGRCLDSNCDIYGYEIEYTLLDRNGNTIRAVAKLTDHTGATMNTLDYVPTIAVAPDGRIGVMWYRYLYNPNTAQTNYNVYFAILGPGGNVIVGPTRVTNNAAWGTWNDLNIPRFYYPHISATGNNRFFLTWLREHRTSSGYVDDIYYAIRDTSGNVVRSITRFTNDTPGDDDGFGSLTVTRLWNNRTLLAFQRYGSYGDIYYAVFDGYGGVVKGMANLSNDGTSSWDYDPDAIQLSGGRVVVAWQNYSRRIRFAVLDTNYSPVADPVQLDNPAAVTGDFYVSVAADANGRAVLTWADYNSSYRRTLYYALVNGMGTVLTPAMPFRWSTAGYMVTSYQGHGNTSLSTAATEPDLSPSTE